MALALVKSGLKLRSPQSEQNSLTFPDPQQNSLTLQKFSFLQIFPDAGNPGSRIFYRVQENYE